MQEWRDRRGKKKCSDGKNGTVRGETEGREKEREFFSLWMLSASMQVLIKRIQKRGARPFCVDMWERVIWWGGGLTSPPHLPVPCSASALFPRFATEPPSCTCVPQHQEKPSGQRDGRGLRGAQLVYPPPPTSPPYIHVRPNSPGHLWEGKWSTFIYTLGPWNQRLSLWAVGVRSLRRPLDSRC